MNLRNSIFILVMASVVFAACRGTGGLSKNERLFTGANVSVSSSTITARERKAMRKSLQGLVRPKPNSVFLGMRIKLAIYNMFRNSKKGLFKNIRDKYGEPPVLLSQFDLQTNNKMLGDYMINKGWFRSKVKGDTTVKSKVAFAKFAIEAGRQHKINAVTFPADSSEASLAIAQTKDNTLLKPGAPFDIDVIRAERQRIDASLKEKGFYFFGPDYILVKTDSTIGDDKVNMFVVVKPETPLAARRIYRINDIYIYAGYNLNGPHTDTAHYKAEYSNGYNIIDPAKRYKPRLFDETMQFHPGEVYNRTDHNRTLNRLINLNLFRFVKNRFEVVTGTDSAKLNTFYYLTPQPRHSLKVEVSVVTRSNNLNGSQINLSSIDRNIGRSGTQFRFTAYIGSDAQFSGALRGYNTYRYGAEAQLAIPRFAIPFYRYQYHGPYAPRTNFLIGYDILERKKLYTLNSYRFEYGFAWKKTIQRQQQLVPISITYAEPLNVTQAYKDIQATIPGLARAIEPQFIPGSRYEYIYNEMANDVQPKSAWYYDFVADLSGNIAGLLTGANTKRGKTIKVGTVPFSQYVKFETDVRHYLKVGWKSTWVNRIDVGIGLPYGNSTQIPYVKQFFIGGNNSLRGFRSRSVGPGTYFPVNANNFIPDQTGDMKLEMNSEFRPYLGGALYGALFVDAGNIWLVNDSVWTGKPGAQFSSKFLSQLAVDMGVGLRLDITIFVIRLDVGFPIRKPWVIPPLVINQIDFANQSWRKQNIVYNLAIGYPF